MKYEDKKLTTEQQKLVTDNLGLAWMFVHGMVKARMANQMFRGNTNRYYDQETEELIDAAYIGLCIAAQRYSVKSAKKIAVERDDETCKFSSYASWYIRQQVRMATNEMEFRSAAKWKRYAGKRVVMMSEIKRKSSETFPGFHDDGTEFDVWDSRQPEQTEMEDKEDRELGQELFVLLNLSLDERKARFIYEYFIEEKTLQTIGDNNWISKERVRQVIERAIADLKSCQPFMTVLMKRYERRKRLSIDDVYSVGKLIA